MLPSTFCACEAVFTSPTFSVSESRKYAQTTAAKINKTSTYFFSEGPFASFRAVLTSASVAILNTSEQWLRFFSGFFLAGRAAKYHQNYLPHHRLQVFYAFFYLIYYAFRIIEVLPYPFLHPVYLNLCFPKNICNFGKSFCILSVVNRFVITRERHRVSL